MLIFAQIYKCKNFRLIVDTIYLKHPLLTAVAFWILDFSCLLQMSAATQWPACPEKLACMWSRLCHGSRAATLCAAGLTPFASHGMTTFLTPDGSPTELTCALCFKPGHAYIHSSRLVLLALCCMFQTMSPTAAVAFCKSKWNAGGAFWCGIRTYLQAAVDIPPTINEATKVDNPNCRSFVLRAWLRLQCRVGLNYTERFVEHATASPWAEGTWTPTLCKWLTQMKAPYVMCQANAADFVAGGIGVAISKRDRVALLLMTLFRDPLAWGERMPVSSAIQSSLQAFPELHAPRACTEHAVLLSSIRLRTSLLAPP